MEEEIGIFPGEIEHRLSKMNQIKTLEQIKKEAEELSLASPRYASSSKSKIEDNARVTMDGTDKATDQLKLDTRSKINFIESIKQEVLHDPEFKQNLLNELRNIQESKQSGE
jgi:hypothetical protein